jgi:hypothetical protein
MPAEPIRQYGSRDFRLAEHLNARVHIYASLEAANADLANAAARVIYVSSVGAFYGGIPGAWVPLSAAGTGWPFREVAVSTELVAEDRAKLVLVNSSSPVSITLPDELDIGSRFQIINRGTGQVTIVTSPATLLAAGTKLNQYGRTELILLDASTWIGTGDLVA